MRRLARSLGLALGAAFGLVACPLPPTPPQVGCPVGMCCYFGPGAEDPGSGYARLRPLPQTPRRSDEADPCGPRGVDCGGGACCWQGDVCGPPAPPPRSSRWP